MTAEYLVPEEEHQHLHQEITPEDRETASKIGELLGKSTVAAMIRSLEQDIAVSVARDPNDPQIASMRYELELWYQSSILAHQGSYSVDGYTPED